MLYFAIQYLQLTDKDNNQVPGDYGKWFNQWSLLIARN
jgi:hypothetical protein